MAPAHDRQYFATNHFQYVLHPALLDCKAGMRPSFYTHNILTCAQSRRHVDVSRPRSVWFDKCVSVQCYHLSDKNPTPDESSQRFIYYLNIFSIRMHLLFLY